MTSNIYLLISAPADPTKQDTVNKLKGAISAKAHDLANVHPFALPEFKIGTLDALYILSDDLAKLDPFLESVALKISDNLKMLLNNDLQQWRNSLAVNESKSLTQNLPSPLENPKKSKDFLNFFGKNNRVKQGLQPALACALVLSSPLTTLSYPSQSSNINLLSLSESLEEYMSNFQWNGLKYRSDKSLRELTDVITQEATSIDSLMKTKIQSYSQTKTQLTAHIRKQNGNLSVKNLNSVVKKEHFVLDSEYLVTLLVAVPRFDSRQSESEWNAQYETLTQMVVPRSSTKIAQDEEFVLYNVTVFRRIVPEFTQKARELKFVVRDFSWDDKAMALEREEALRISVTEKEQWNSLLRLCKANFGEVYQCVMHLKALRIYVESILRYGLPPNFQPMVIETSSKNSRKAKTLLNEHYAKLSGLSSSFKTDAQMEENMASILGEKDYSPCVLFTVAFPQ